MTENLVDAGDNALNESTNDYVTYSETDIDASKEEDQQVENPKEEAEAPEAGQDSDNEEQKPKKPTGYQRKIYNQQQEIAALQQKIAELEGKLNPQPAKQVESDGEPNAADYENAMDYMRDLAKWQAQNSLAQYKLEAQAQAEQAKQIAEYEAKQNDFNARVAKIMETVPDFYERAQSLYDQGLVTPEVENAVLDSPVGEMVSLYFMAHPQELANLSGMTAPQVYREVALIEAKLLAGNGSQQVAKRQTNAAEPINPVRAPATTQKSISDDIPYEEWVKMRNKQVYGR